MEGKEKMQRDFADFLMKSNSKKNFLDKINKFINWERIADKLRSLYSSGEGRPSYPPIVMFKAILLAQWYNLSDPELEEQLNDRISFRKFIGLSISEEIPDETTICRFRQRLAKNGFGEEIFRIINLELASKGVLLKKGSIIDASLIKSEFHKDKEGGWAKQKEKAVFGYKLHTAVEEGNGLIQDLEMTAANVHESKVFEEILPEGVETVYADKAYDTEERRYDLKMKKIKGRILYKRVRGQRYLGDVQEYRNKLWSSIRGRIERCFAHLKEIYGFAKVKYQGLKNNLNHAFLLACAYNLKRALKLC